MRGIADAAQKYNLQYGKYPDSFVDLENGAQSPLGKPPSSVVNILGNNYGFKKINENMRVWGYLEKEKAYYVWDSACPQFIITTSDPNGDTFDCTHERADDETPVAPPPPPATYKISGYIDVQGRSDDKGVTVTFRQGSDTYFAVNSSWGHYEVNVPAGTYTVTADMNLYLSAQTFTNVTADSTLPNTVIRGGDANDDGKIDSIDQNLIGSNFGKKCGDSGFDLRADINKDCMVDILDLVLMGGNFGLTQPTTW